LLELTVREEQTRGVWDKVISPKSHTDLRIETEICVQLPTTPTLMIRSPPWLSLDLAGVGRIVLRVGVEVNVILGL